MSDDSLGPDPLGPLRATPPTVIALAAAEVRRRGDRLRRRRAGVAVLGGAAVAATVVALVASLSSPAPQQSPPPAVTTASDTPTPIVLPTSIPAGIDLVGDLTNPESGEPVIQGSDTTPTNPVVCKAAALPTDDVVDQAGAAASGPEYAESDALWLYPNESAAHDALAAMAATITACAQEQYTTTVWVYTLGEPALAGDEGLSLSLTYRNDGMPTPGGSFWEFTRLGNAIFGVVIGGEYAPDSGPQVQQDLRGRYQPLVDDICTQLGC